MLHKKLQKVLAAEELSGNGIISVLGDQDHWRRQTSELLFKVSRVYTPKCVCYYTLSSI